MLLDLFQGFYRQGRRVSPAVSFVAHSLDPDWHVRAAVISDLQIGLLVGVETASLLELQVHLSQVFK